MRRAAKKDLNHNAIRDTLRGIGVTVIETYQLGGGFPDLLWTWRGATGLIEVKGKGEKLTEAEAKFHTDYPGALAVVVTPADAYRAVGAEVEV